VSDYVGCVATCAFFFVFVCTHSGEMKLVRLASGHLMRIGLRICLCMSVRTWLRCVRLVCGYLLKLTIHQECVELYLHFPNTSSWRGA